MKQRGKKENEVQGWRTEQRLIEEYEEEEEQYKTIDEDGRPYIAVRMKQGDKQENKEQEWRTEKGQGNAQEKTEQRIIEETKEEEQYMTIGEDGRLWLCLKWTTTFMIDCSLSLENSMEDLEEGRPA